MVSSYPLRLHPAGSKPRLRMHRAGPAHLPPGWRTHRRGISALHAFVALHRGYRHHRPLTGAPSQFRLPDNVPCRQDNRDEVFPLEGKILEETKHRYNSMLISVFEVLADARSQTTGVNPGI